MTTNSSNPCAPSLCHSLHPRRLPVQRHAVLLANENQRQPRLVAIRCSLAWGMHVENALGHLDIRYCTFYPLSLSPTCHIN